MEKRDLRGRLEEERLLKENPSEDNSSEEQSSKEQSPEEQSPEEKSSEESCGAVFFGDEMRLGLISQVRRRWAPRGVKIRQPVEFEYEWLYLNLAVDPLEGSLKWAWTPDMKAESIAPVLEAWEEAPEEENSEAESPEAESLEDSLEANSLEAIVWDGAKGHQGEE